MVATNRQKIVYSEPPESQGVGTKPLWPDRFKAMTPGRWVDATATWGLKGSGGIAEALVKNGLDGEVVTRTMTNLRDKPVHVFVKINK